MKTDFYLKDFDYYIEYTGMGNMNYEKKKKILKKYNIHNVFYSDSVDDIKNFINKLNKIDL